MPRRGAYNAATKAVSIRENVRVRGDDAVLSGRNEADNPKFDRFTEAGALEGITLSGPLEDIGFTVYDHGPGLTGLNRQGFVPIFQGQWDQNFPLVTSGSPPDQNTQSRVTPYTSPPILEAIPDARTGFTAGWHGVTYALAVEVRPGSWYRYTEVAPLTVLQLTQNQGIRVNFDISVSESVVWIALCLTPPYATEIEAANSSDVYVQERVKTRPRIPAVKDLWGPYGTWRELSFLSSGNDTYIEGIPDAPRIKVSKSSEAAWKPQLAYSYPTDFGRSLSSKVRVHTFDRSRVRWHPDGVPSLAKKWTPEYVDAEGNWRAFSPRKIGEWAELDTNIPARLAPYKKLPIERNEVDNTSGIEGPDSPLGNVTAIGKTLPAPGIHRVRITKNGIDRDGQEQEESAPSPLATLNVPAGHFLRVRPPVTYGQMLPNAEGTLIDATTNVPDGWEYPAASGVTYDRPEVGKHSIVDISGGTGSQDVFLTARAPVTGQPDVTVVSTINIPAHTSGEVLVRIRQTMQDNSTSTFTVATFNTEGTYYVKARITDTGSNVAMSGTDPASVVWATATVKDIRIVVTHNGAGASGIRNCTTEFYNAGVHQGLSHPHKRVPVDPATLQPSEGRYASLSTEASDLAFPIGGYALTVIDPPDSQRAYTDDLSDYIPGNMVEYFGVPSQPQSSIFFMGDARFGTKGNEQRVISVHLFWEGATEPATPLRLLLRDADGAVVSDRGGFVTDVTGDSRDAVGADPNGYVRASISFIAEPDAVIAEIAPSSVGPGLFRVMGIQYEYGSVVTPFTDDYPETGSIISTFDFGIPGVEAGQFKSLNHIPRIVSFGADVTHAAPEDIVVTSHTVLARSKHYDDTEYSDWTETAEGLWLPADGNGMVQIGTILSTDNPDYTPVLHGHFVDFERVPDGSHNGMTVGSFLRGDGSEFSGTATAYNVPILDTQKPIVEEEFADNSIGYATMGSSTRKLIGFGVEFYLQSAAEEANQLLGEGLEFDEDQDEEASLFQIWIQNKKYRVRIVNMDIQVDRSLYSPITGMEHEGRWLFRAEGIEGEVISVEDM